MLSYIQFSRLRHLVWKWYELLKAQQMLHVLCQSDSTTSAVVSPLFCSVFGCQVPTWVWASQDSATPVTSPRVWHTMVAEVVKKRTTDHNTWLASPPFQSSLIFSISSVTVIDEDYHSSYRDHQPVPIQEIIPTAMVMCSCPAMWFLQRPTSLH